MKKLYAILFLVSSVIALKASEETPATPAADYFRAKAKEKKSEQPNSPDSTAPSQPKGTPLPPKSSPGMQDETAKKLEEELKKLHSKIDDLYLLNAEEEITPKYQIPCHYYQGTNRRILCYLWKASLKNKDLLPDVKWMHQIYHNRYHEDIDLSKVQLEDGTTVGSYLENHKDTPHYKIYQEMQEHYRTVQSNAKRDKIVGIVIGGLLVGALGIVICQDYKKNHPYTKPYQVYPAGLATKNLK